MCITPRRGESSGSVSDYCCATIEAEVVEGEVGELAAHRFQSQAKFVLSIGLAVQQQVAAAARAEQFAARRAPRQRLS